MWTSARAWGYVAHDLMEGVVLPELKRVKRFFFSQREIQHILAKAKEPQRTWYGLAAETGLRAGELCGLAIDDLDLERGLLQVQRSAWRGKLKPLLKALGIRVPRGNGFHAFRHANATLMNSFGASQKLRQQTQLAELRGYVSGAAGRTAGEYVYSTHYNAGA